MVAVLNIRDLRAIYGSTVCWLASRTRWTGGCSFLERCSCINSPQRQCQHNTLTRRRDQKHTMRGLNAVWTINSIYLTSENGQDLCNNTQQMSSSEKTLNTQSSTCEINAAAYFKTSAYPFAAATWSAVPPDLVCRVSWIWPLLSHCRASLSMIRSSSFRAASMSTPGVRHRRLIPSNWH